MTTHTIAIVDDHARVRDSIANLLVAAKFETVSFSAAEDFLEYCHADGWTQLSCLVLDVRLPGLSGIELQLELTERNIRLPVILISGHATPEVAEQGRKNGAVTLLEKPFDGEVLVQEIRNAIGRLQSTK